MEIEWKRRFTWIQLDELDGVFLNEPFPLRGDRGDLGTLRASIARFGVIHPIIARVKQGKLQIVCGYRRWLAAQVAGIGEVPVAITNLTDAQAVRLFAEENREWQGAPADRSAPEPAVESRNALLRALRLRASDGDIASSGRMDREKILPGLQDACSECIEVFGSIRRERRIVPERMEALANRLRLMVPGERSVDIREVGPAFSENTHDWLGVHSVRVALLAQSFARHLGWPEEVAAQLSLSALLHDVGMLFIPVDCFAVPLPLTAARQEALKAHTAFGRDLIAGTRCWAESMALVAQDHHERWDGTGYPAGKKGRAVSLPARIIGLLDTYAAMISKRFHRPPYLLSEALQNLRESAKIGLFEPALERQFRLSITSRPVGMRCRLSDGSLIQVEDVQVKRAKSHLLYVQESGRQFQQGEEIWYREKELQDQAVEVADGSWQQKPIAELQRTSR